MRQKVLFQGKRKDNGEWIDGFYYEDIAGESVILSRPYDFGYADAFNVYPETVGQFTGYYDHSKWDELTPDIQEKWLRNHTVDDWQGRPIFENQVVRIQLPVFSSTYINAVIRLGEYSGGMTEAAVGFYFDFGKSSWFRNEFGYWIKHATIKVIGNIHDNPELLEEKENG